MFRLATLLVAAMSLAIPVDAPLRAQGQCPNCDLPPGCRGNGNGNGNGRGNQRNCQTLEISIDADIDFGRLVLIGDGEGKVLLDLNSGRKSTSGNIDDLGGIAITGVARITGAPNEPVRIFLPTNITMSDTGGSEAELRDLVTDLPALPMLDMDGQLEFRFAGTLVTGAETARGGKLRGRIPISVEYQ